MCTVRTYYEYVLTAVFQVGIKLKTRSKETTLGFVQFLCVSFPRVFAPYFVFRNIAEFSFMRRRARTVLSVVDIRDGDCTHINKTVKRQVRTRNPRSNCTRNGKSFEEPKMDGTNVEKLDRLMPIFVVAEVIGLLSVILMFYWCTNFLGGFGFSEARLFQWHPLLMTIGFVYLMGNAILIFRIFRNAHKRTLKLIHATINAVGLVLAILGVAAVIINHNQQNTANFYSLHSWVGILAIGFYLVQAAVSIFAYLLNGVSNALKAMLLPYHVFVGHLIFVLGLCAAISGIDEKAIFKLGGTVYGNLGTEALVLNLTGISLVFFGILVVYITTNVYYKRYSRPEDNQLLERTN